MPRHRPKGWRVFCREVKFFWSGARAGRMTALAYKIFRGGVNGACGMNTTTPTACVGKKRNGTAKNVTARLALIHCPTTQY
jgi:hypothetical protein